MLGFKAKSPTVVKATAYWWNEKPNFGDALTPHLLRRFSGIEAERGTISKSSIAACGSVLEHVPPEWDGYIVGAGMMREGSLLHLHTNTATVLAVRGPLSRQALAMPGCNPVLGDPGLLADELVNIETRKYSLGLVPHWADKELTKRPEFLKYNPRIIDPAGDPLEVIKQIGECDKIVSSSLHGIIVADSFGLQRRFEYPKSWDDSGGMFKYRDYSAAIGAAPVVGETIRPNKFYIEDVKDQLFDVFAELGHLVRSGK